MSEATDSAVCYNQSEDLELEESSQPKDNKVGHLFFLELICTCRIGIYKYSKIIEFLSI